MGRTLTVISGADIEQQRRQIADALVQVSSLPKDVPHRDDVIQGLIDMQAAHLRWASAVCNLGYTVMD